MGGHDNRRRMRYRPHWTGYVAFFTLLSVVYHSNLRPIASGDSLQASLIPFSIILDGSITLDRFGPYINSHVPYAPEIIYKSGRHWYSRYPIAGPVLVAPLYLPFAPWLRHSSPGFLLAIARIAEKAAAHVRAFAPLLAVTALAAGYNLTAFGRITGGYAPEFGRHPLAALASILVSPGRGLLVYTPAALFALLAFAPIARDSLARHRPIAFAGGIFSLLQLASMAIWPVWWGGYCWGPRLLTEILAPRSS